MATYQSKYTGAEIDAGIDAARAALPKNGGTMIGALILAGDPADDNGAVTKKYVDDAVNSIALTPGEDGKDGADGVSPTIAVTKINDGHRVTITDVNGTQSFDVMDGEDGSGGGSGGTGAGGEDGATFTPSVSSDGVLSWTNDKGLINPDPVNIKGEPGENNVHIGADEPTSDSINLWVETDSEESYNIPEINDDAVSNVDTWSSAKIHDAISYSTDEVLTGGTWIDGKPIYRKVITVSGAANTLKTVNASMGNAAQVVNVGGSVYLKTSNPYYAPVTFVSTASGTLSTNFYMYLQDGYLNARATAAFDAWIIFEYTKA